MHLHPAIAALRSDDAPQRQAQAALFAAVGEWREAIAEVADDLARFGSGEAIAECQGLAVIFSDYLAATAFVDAFTVRIAAALGTAPLAHVPLRHFTDGTVSTLLLARSGRATLSLTAVDGAGLAKQAPPRAAGLTASDSWEVVLAGRGRAELIGEARQELALSPGSAIVRDCARQALVLRAVTGMLVSLRLQRRHAAPAPTREIDLVTGAVIHQAAATAAESRHELMIALLGRMGRSDAAPALAAIARTAGPAAMRWQALRECLGLDTRGGFEVLTAIAQGTADPLALPAEALRAQLVERHPELALCLA